MSKRSNRLQRGLACLVVFGSLTVSSFGQSEEAKRKVKIKVTPVYPDLAKRMNVTGKAKIEVVITPDGRVKAARAVGGHPLLVQACQDAVERWKFFPAPEESTQILECDFSSGS